MCSMETLKKIFSLKKNGQNEDDWKTDKEDQEQIRITYYQSGFAASQKAMGKSLVFKACLENVYNSFEDQCRKQLVKQKRLKQPYVEEKVRQTNGLKKLETVKGIYEGQNKEFEQKTEKAHTDIRNVKHEPDKYGLDVDKRPKMQLYIGLVIIIPITIYLLVFYISASYSSFFKEFSEDSLTAAIFDANALNNSFNASWLEGLLVVTIPFVFMGLGYLIHMLQKEKNIISNLKLVGLLFITFLFDGLLAYQIEKKIYEFNKTLDSPPYNLKIALGESEFWMIIFAGFVVYLIWGLVFDFVMKEYENLDKINVFIKTRKEEIKSIEFQKSKTSEKINEVIQKITFTQGKIAELQSKLDGYIFPVKEYLHYHHQYKEGWFQAINTEIALPNKQKNELLESCELACKEHLNRLNLNEMDHQHVVYSTVN